MKFLHIFFLFLFTVCPQFIEAQTYSYDYKLDKEYFYGSLLFSASSYVYKYSQEARRIEKASEIDINNLWGIDKSAVNQNSSGARHWSDITMYASIAAPIGLIAGIKGIRSQSSNIILMGLQGFFIENGITQYIKVFAERPRPFLYWNDPTVFTRELPRTATESFISGHTSNSAYFAFFAAKIFADTHPDSKIKPLVWTAAAVLPMATGYLRYKAGKHFPTDVISGYILGSTLGILIPQLYKSKTIDLNMSSNGMFLSITF